MDDWAFNVMSSANIEVTTSGAASLTAVASGADAMENQRGERGLPCGVPSLKILSFERASPQRTFALRSDSHELSQRSHRPGMPIRAAVLNAPPLQTTSKAAFTSTAARRDLLFGFGELSPAKMLAWIPATASSADLPLLKPACSTGKTPFDSAHTLILTLTMLSKVFASADVRLTGLKLWIFEASFPALRMGTMVARLQMVGT